VQKVGVKFYSCRLTFTAALVCCCWYVRYQLPFWFIKTMTTQLILGTGAENVGKVTESWILFLRGGLKLRTTAGLYSGAKIPIARSPWLPHFVRQRLIFVCPRYGTCFGRRRISTWILDFWKICAPLGRSEIHVNRER